MTPEAGDHFGWAVATGDINADTCADLVVGAPGADLPEPDAGAVHVVYGSQDGLNGDIASEHLTQSDSGGVTETGDHFGQTVAVGENLGQDTTVVVAGAPDEDNGATSNVGAVNIINFSDTIPVQPRQVSQSTAGIPSDPEAGDGSARHRSRSGHPPRRRRLDCWWVPRQRGSAAMPRPAR